MTNEQILKKAVEKAVKNGFELEEMREDKMFWKMITDKEWYIETDFYFSLIFSHDFAKAFWGEKEIVEIAVDRKEKKLFKVVNAGWEIELQEMVLEKEPLKYLEKFLK